MALRLAAACQAYAPCALARKEVMAGRDWKLLGGWCASDRWELYTFVVSLVAFVAADDEDAFVGFEA